MNSGAIPGYVLELALVAGGLAVLVQLYRRRRSYREQRAPAWPGTFADVVFFIIAVIVPILAGHAVLQLVINREHVTSEAAVLLASVLVFEASLFAGIAAFNYGYLRLRLGLALRLGQGAGLFLAVLPIIFAVSALWQSGLSGLGYPVTHQNLVDSFMGLRSPVGRGLFVLFAAVIAPMTEEIIFRGALFRGLKLLLPRWAAIWLSAALFAAAHADLSTFLPLAVLGAIFALAYDITGSLAVTMLAHALFNLNTIVALLLGVTS